jgi:Sap, sulfolipid-1-addressing protein
VSPIVTILLLGLLASLSPTTIVVFILLLATNRARANAAAFLIGWSVSLFVVFAASYAIGASHEAQQGSGRTALEILEILLGVALVLAGQRRGTHRSEPRTSSGIAKRLNDRLQRLNPWEAAVVGVLKEPWTLTAAAAVVVVRDDVALLTAVIAFVVFTVVSTATVAGTYVYFSRRPGEANDHLEALRDRVVQSGPLIVTVVWLLVGGYLVLDGVVGIVNR